MKPRYWSLRMLRITNCSDSLLWYADMVGQLVPFGGDDGQYGFRSREPAGHLNFVRRADARVVTVRVHTINRQRWPFNGKDAKAVVEVPRAQCGALCDELGVCQGLQECVRPGLAAAQGKCPGAMVSHGQTRMFSIVETVVSIALGFVISLGITAVVMPAFGHPVTLNQNLAITGIFTVASLLRTYALRRFFNRIYLRRFS